MGCGVEVANSSSTSLSTGCLLTATLMSAPLSADLRRRILAALDAGEGSQRHIAQRFRVGRATVERLVRRVRETGSMDPKPHGGGQRPRLVETDREQLLAWLEADPDLRQEDIADRFKQMKRPMSQQAVSRGLRRLGITRKKRRFGPSSN